MPSPSHRAAHRWALPLPEAGEEQIDLNKSQIGAVEIADVGEDGAEGVVGDSEPVGEGRGILVGGGARQQAALANLFVAFDRDRGGGAVEAAAMDRAADHEMVAAPAMIGAVAIVDQGA